MASLSFPDSVRTLRLLPDFPALVESVLDFQAIVMPIRRAIITIPTGTTSGRTTVIPNRIHTITAARDIPGTMEAELTTVTIAIIITTTIELT